MNTINVQKCLQSYKAIERYAHISFDDIMNKVSQEVAELLEATQTEDFQEIHKEACDTLINILSVANELGIHNFSPEIQATQPLELCISHGKWNSKIQALRNKYSKEKSDIHEIEIFTQRLVSQVLAFTDRNISLEDIVQQATQKFESRKDLYKRKIHLEDYITSYENFPKPGINFKDISPLIGNQEALEYAIYEMTESCRGADVIVGLDARGFIFGSLIAKNLNKPFVMLRKKGKLPGKTLSISYGLEYGKDTLEIQEGIIQVGQKVALVDDLLATGGTIQAAIDLVEKSGGIVNNLSFVVSLDEENLSHLSSRQSLQKYPQNALIHYN